MTIIELLESIVGQSRVYYLNDYSRFFHDDYKIYILKFKITLKP
jgi:hypothetical protein